MKKFKIYIFHPYSRVGGADVTISRLINNLDDSKYDITFICLDKPVITKYLKKKIEILVLNRTRSIFSFFDLKNIIRKNCNIDKNYKKVIFISNQNFANIITIASLRRFYHLKLILIERNNPVELDYLGTFKSTIVRILLKYTYKYADAIVGISKGLSKDLSRICSKDVITIYNPSFDKKFIKKGKPKKYKDKIILCVARLEKQKNHLMLLEAFKRSLGSLDSNLVLIGYGPEKQTILSYIKKNKLSKKIKIISDSSNLQKYYNSANLFVLTSLYEGFGNVLVEAASFKIPIISTNCKSGPKEILQNGKFGDLVKINDHKKLAQLIVNNLRKPNKSKISKMYNSLYRFNITNHIKKYEEIFKKI